MDSGKRFDPTKYLKTIKVRGGAQQPYLPVTARLLWLRAEHPQAQVTTEALRLDEKGAIFKATVTLPDGGVAVGHGSETAGDFGDFIEKAETKAIGRALTALGYGTEFAEGQDDPTLAAATEVAPAAPPPVIALPATTSAAAPAPPAQLRPERLSRQQERTPEPPPERMERPARQPEAAPRPERPERFARQQEPAEAPERAERFAPTPRGLTTDRPLRPERIQRAEPAEEAPPTSPPAERALRPERLSRLREAAPTAPPAPATTSEPEPAAEEAAPAPTPIRRSGRTLAAGRSFAAATPTATPPPAPTPAPEPPRPAPRAEEPEEDADDIEMAMISTTAFWRWARSKGYADRRAVEAATGKSMDAMTPREAYYRLKEVLAREGNA